MARFGHRFGSIASVLALVGGMLLAPAPPIAAAACSVTNEGTGTTYGTLREAVNGSSDGDTLLVSGTCVGMTTIRHGRLVLKGVPTTEQPTPTLDGGGVDRVLQVKHAKVVIRDITITNGHSTYFGGIDAWQAQVTLAGNTSVRNNEAVTYYDGGSAGTYGGDGGGIGVWDGSLTLRGAASVRANVAQGGYGGGIVIGEGVLRLNGSASVAQNTSGGSGGGIYGTQVRIILNDSSSVTGNTAESLGGGIFNVGAAVLNNSASVTGNTADRGGGIFNATYDAQPRVYVCSDEVAISPNDPDDPPKVRHLCP